ncbi:hypothetical protein [Desulfobacter curvatus]|uniref:hypothetical protein n=1 Tax=Desulfobacter curvatus TaxID=2290 RepID=UPI000368D962|nr:hypothetical protein [Desulfobacter curvatus]
MGKQIRKKLSKRNKKKPSIFNAENIATDEKKQAKYNKLNTKIQDMLKGLGLDSEKMNFIDNPDQIKMSAVILKIVEPYIKMYWGDEIKVRGIISLSIMIWNMAYLPQEKQNKLQEQWIEDALPSDCDAQDVASMLSIFESLQKRQKDLFPDIRKFIMGHELRLDNENIHLNISSAPLCEKS